MLTLDHIAETARTLERENAKDKQQRPAVAISNDEDEFADDYGDDDDKENRAPTTEGERERERDATAKKPATVDSVLRRAEMAKHLRTLRTRLKFAQFKLDNGWESRSLRTVEALWCLKRQQVTPFPAPSVSAPLPTTSLIPRTAEVLPRLTLTITEPVLKIDKSAATVDRPHQHLKAIKSDDRHNTKRRCNEILHADAVVHLRKLHGAALTRRHDSGIHLFGTEHDGDRRRSSRQKNKTKRDHSIKRSSKKGRKRATTESRILRPLPVFDKQYRGSDAPLAVTTPLFAEPQLPSIANALNFDLELPAPAAPLASLVRPQKRSVVTTPGIETVAYKKRRRDPSIASAVSSSSSSATSLPCTPPSGAALLDLPASISRRVPYVIVPPGSKPRIKPVPVHVPLISHHDDPRSNDPAYPLARSSHCRSVPAGTPRAPLVDLYEPPQRIDDNECENEPPPAVFVGSPVRERYMTATGEPLSSPAASAAQTIMMFVKGVPGFNRDGRGWEGRDAEGERKEGWGAEDTIASPGVYEDEEDLEEENEGEECSEEVDELDEDEEEDEDEDEDEAASIDLEAESEEDAASPERRDGFELKV
ncbi:hypothetical protein BC937DRAFT_90329 [Endogone sp. FLAS-F59071]|nr:hypothetical protein BC937DRAFT_90329 [Endogone sp. FLAS-F59071]|eukprot:RUS17155.1 hypothetical protein BC937DRAFT_90329 [Endogone sp. FLAS-F59071]